MGQCGQACEAPVNPVMGGNLGRGSEVGRSRKGLVDEVRGIWESGKHGDMARHTLGPRLFWQ